MRPVNQAVGMQGLQILANRNLRGFELAGQIHYQHAAVALQDFENSPTTLFVEQEKSLPSTHSRAARADFFLYRLLSIV